MIALPEQTGRAFSYMACFVPPGEPLSAAGLLG